MDQQQSTPEALAFSVTFGKNGGCSLIINGEETFDVCCSHPYEMGEYIRNLIGTHTRQPMTPPQYMLPAPVYQPQQPPARPRAHTPPLPGPTQPPVEQDPFRPPQFMEERPPLVDRIANVMAQQNGKTAAVILMAGLASAQVLSAIWPFGA